LHARLVACGGRGASVRKLGGDRAGEMRISRFLHNRRLTPREIVQTAIARPKNGKDRARLPKSLMANLVEAREIDPPDGEEPAHWRLLTTHNVNDVADARRIVGFYRLRWTVEQLFRTTKTKGFDIEALRQQEGGRPLSDAFDRDDQPVLERVGSSLEGKTAKQKNPHPKGSLAFASWVFARLGGWTGYYGKPGPIVMLRGLTEFHAIKHGRTLRDV
jgi:Transposase DDE domain